MGNHSMKIVMLGPPHSAPACRRLLHELAVLGHDVMFLQRDAHSAVHDEDGQGYGCRALYAGADDLRENYRDDVSGADAVIVCSGLAELPDIGRWAAGTTQGISLLYDTDAPATLSMIENGDDVCGVRGIVPLFDAYLSSSGGTVLDAMRNRYGARNARTLYPSPDALLYHPIEAEKRWDLGYLGDNDDRHSSVLRHMVIDPAAQWLAGRFAVAGNGYPGSLPWPVNVDRKERIEPCGHASFFASQRFVLSVTDEALAHAGYSPPARLFEIAACGIPIICDYWKGLESFFDLGKDILIASSKEHVLHYLKKLHEEERIAVGQRARSRVLARHTTAHRARELESAIVELLKRRSVLCAVS